MLSFAVSRFQRIRPEEAVSAVLRTGSAGVLENHLEKSEHLEAWRRGHRAVAGLESVREEEILPRLMELGARL